MTIPKSERATKRKPRAATSKAPGRKTLPVIADVGEVTILDVGHGNAAIVCSGGATSLIDAGPGTSLLEHLTRSGVSCIDSVFVSHADKDHLEGLVVLLAQNIPIRAVYLNPDGVKESELWDDVAHELNTRRIATVGVNSQLAPVDCGGAKIQVVAPSVYLALKGVGGDDSNGHGINSNSLSVVLRVSCGSDRGVLFTGDLDNVGLADIERLSADIGADVLIYPHHGGRCASDDRAFAQRLTRAVQPSQVVFSMERNGSNAGNPRQDHIYGVRDTVPSVRILCTQLSRNCAPLDPSKLPDHLLPLFARGHASRSCCAGSLRLMLPTNQLSPGMASHLEFIRSNAPTALCQAVVPPLP